MMDATPPSVLEELAEIEIEQSAFKHADRVIAAIRSVPDFAVVPEFIAQIAAALSNKASALSGANKEIAQNYLDDLYCDMRG
jgi:hypothetical protein